jgi:hypothetical protein
VRLKSGTIWSILIRCIPDTSISVEDYFLGIGANSAILLVVAAAKLAAMLKVIAAGTQEQGAKTHPIIVRLNQVAILNRVRRSEESRDSSLRSE